MLDRQESRIMVEISGFQSGQRRRVIVNDTINDLVEPGFSSPVLVVARKNDCLTGIPSLEFEWPGSDRGAIRGMPVEGFGPLFDVRIGRTARADDVLVRNRVQQPFGIEYVLRDDR